MTSSLVELMMLEKLMGNKSSIFDNVKELEAFMKERDDKKKASEKPKPPTFSAGQAFLLVFGAGPIVGLGALIAYSHLLQYALDAIRQLH